MIDTPISYLFSLAFIATFFYQLKKYFYYKIFKYIPIPAIIFLFSFFLSNIGFFQFNEDIKAIYLLTKTNLLPAMVFLILVQVNFKNFGNIGCACTIGTKKYWLLILLSIIISFVSQYISWHINILNKTLALVLIASFLAIIASFTRLKEINGSKEVATSMFYLFVALIGSNIL